MTGRYVELLMCMEWGMSPAEFDVLSRSSRLEMRTFFMWHKTRTREAQKLQALNAKFFPKHGGS